MRDVTDDRRLAAIRLWLYAVAGLVFLMVLVGGATRITDSGLSIVEWRPVTGTLPPLTHAQWLEEFEKYRQIPEYQLQNRGMSLEAFKFIYWWEWGHRFLGRLIGAAFLLPFLFFLWKGWVPQGYRWRLWGLFALGGLQGAIGWWMVASGLVGRVDVAPYRLAVHLTLACVIFVALVWTARSLARPLVASPVPRRIGIGARLVLGLVLLQIYLGGLVAGLDAGMAFNTWPLIDGRWLPASAQYLAMSPAWVNFFENALNVQFNHRVGAYLLTAVVAWHVVDCVRTLRAGPAVTTALWLGAGVTVQVTIGILTLVHVVPVSLALIHQGAAVVLLAIAAVHAQALAVASRTAPGEVPGALRAA